MEKTRETACFSKTTKFRTVFGFFFVPEVRGEENIRVHKRRKTSEYIEKLNLSRSSNENIRVHTAL